MKDLQPINFPGLDPRRPLVIAGPCSAETEEQVIETARELAAEGVRIFRAGLWKPRTKPGGFEGVGAEGVAWLQRVKRETGMYTATEVATRKHVMAALEGGIDMIWIGARTTANPFAMQEIADALRGHDIPVLVKNPVSPDLELWVGGVERIYNAGIRRLGGIHRGFTSIDKSLYRNHPMWSIPIELHRRLPGLQIFCDPSHIGGRRELIAPLSQQAMDLGFDGLIVEAHCSPDCAWSDKAQQVTPQGLAYICRSLVIREANTTMESLSELRTQFRKALRRGDPRSQHHDGEPFGTAFADRQARRRTARTARTPHAGIARHRTVQERAQHADPAGQTLRRPAGATRGAGRTAGHGPRIHALGVAGHPRGIDPPADAGAGRMTGCYISVKYSAGTTQ